MDSEPFLDHDTRCNTFNLPPEIIIEASNLDTDASTAIMVDDNVDANVEEF